MSFQFKQAKRENVPLLIGIAGPSGSGKTYSAMKLARGMAGDRKFCVIDTEAGRALHYADQFDFDHGELTAPFRPLRYLEAIEQADKQGYPVIVVDSMSHEHAGDGGLIDYQEDELTRMAGNDYSKRERVKMAAWIKPKTEHKKMVTKLLQLRAHLILCFRAEEKVEMIKDGQGRTQIVPKKNAAGFEGWLPVCEKTLPYELTASMIVLPTAPGVPIPIKIQEQHRAFFPTDRPISEDTGKRLAAWAGGAGATRPAPSTAPQAKPQASPVQRMLGVFAEFGVTASMIERFAGCSLDEIDEEMSDRLRDAYGNLKTGRNTVAELFPSPKQDQPKLDGVDDGGDWTKGLD